MTITTCIVLATAISMASLLGYLLVNVMLFITVRCMKQQLAHLFYMGGWKKFEPFWNFMIQYGQLNRMLPVLESLLAHTRGRNAYSPRHINPIIGRAAL